MADVLGKLTFLETPDVNGDLVLTETTGISSISGTSNQIGISGVAPNFTIGLVDNTIIPGNGSLTLPVGTSGQRPVSPIEGMIRYNSTVGNAEYWSNSSWKPVGQVVQVVANTIAQGSSNLQIPYDTSTPQITEGFQLWTQSFTPLYSDSLIIIQSSQWYAVSSTADIIVTGALFRDNTCVTAQMLGWTTNNNDGSSSVVYYVDAAASTATRTYSLRAGPGSNVTIFYNRGATATLGGVATGQFTIIEIAQ